MNDGIFAPVQDAAAHREECACIPEGRYKVLVRCFTFNQAAYIREALEGFAAQQTDFPYVCLVVDDASTDGEPEVIRSWIRTECFMQDCRTSSDGELIVATHRTNRRCTIATYLLHANLYQQRKRKMQLVAPWRELCDYEAICEGDDYWTDPLKLQRQVAFLDAHPDYALVYARASVLKEQAGAFVPDTLGCNLTGFVQLLHDNPIPTLTTCTRISVLRRYINDVDPYSRPWLMGDYPLWLWIAWHYKVCFQQDVVGVYRVLTESASHSCDAAKREAFSLSVVEILTFFCDKFHVPLLLRNRTIHGYYYSIFSDYWACGDFSKMESYYRIIKKRYLPQVHARKLFGRYWCAKLKRMAWLLPGMFRAIFGMRK